MEKTPRYTQRERNMVLGYAAQYKDVIENKRTDAESNRKKDEVWLQIAKEFNSKVYHQRSAKQLRQLYKNMKLLLKKDLCGEDKGNRSFMDLLNTLSQQESVAQYIAEQMSPDGAGSQAATNGRHMADDFEDSKPPLYEGMDTDVILIKSETISDNEQTENGMDCMDDDDDEDCNSPKVPEVCLEEEDEVLFATDLRHMQQQSGGASVGGSLASINGSSTLPNGSNNNISDPLPRAPSSPVCSTKTSISSTGSYISASVPKAEITLSSVGNIRVGAFASINKTLQNGNNNNNSSSSNSCSSSNNNNNNNSLCNNNNNSSECNNNSSSNNNNNNSSLENGLQLTAEQVNQHLLLNGLGLSAVQHAPSQASMQAAINAATSGVGSSRQTQTLQLPRLQRGGHNSGNNSASTAVTAAAIAASALAAAAGGANGGSGNASGVQVLLNGHHRAGAGDKAHAQLQQQQQQQHNHHHHQLSQQQQQTSGLTVAAGSFNGYNGLGVSNISSINCGTALAGNSSNHNNSGNGSNSNNHNNSGGAVGNANHSGSSSSGGSRGQHNEYMMSLALEERKRKIELLNVQIEYWQTLTKKLDSQSGHFPNPACLCHFPGNTVLGAGVAAAGGAVGGVAAAAAGAAGSKSSAASALQTQSSSS